MLRLEPFGFAQDVRVEGRAQARRFYESANDYA